MEKIFFSKNQKVRKNNDYFWFFQPSSQISDLLKNLHLLEIMTSQKQALIGFLLNFTGLNIMKKQKNRFLKKCFVAHVSGHRNEKIDLKKICCCTLICYNLQLVQAVSVWRLHFWQTTWNLAYRCILTSSIDF